MKNIGTDLLPVYTASACKEKGNQETCPALLPVLEHQFYEHSFSFFLRSRSPRSPP